MTDQTPVAAVDESAVEPEHTTNDLAEQDPAEVWIDDDQTPEAAEDLGHTFVAPEDDVVLDADPGEDVPPVASADGSLTIASDGTVSADQVGGAL